MDGEERQKREQSGTVFEPFLSSSSAQTTPPLMPSIANLYSRMENAECSMENGEWSMESCLGGASKA